MEMIELNVKYFKRRNINGFGLLCKILKMVLDDIEYKFDMHDSFNFKNFVKRNRIKKVDILKLINKNREDDYLFDEDDLYDPMYSLEEYFQIKDDDRELFSVGQLRRLDKLVYYLYEYGHFNELFQDWLDEDL